MRETIQHVQFDAYGPPDVLTCAPVPRPAAEPNHLRVAVHAAGVNPVDWRYRQGQLRWIDWGAFPRTPGADVAGVVVAVGTGVDDFRVGDRVCAMLDTRRGGGYAEQVLVPAADAAPIPSALTMVEAAGLPLVTLTAIQALRDQAKLQVGEHVLINGASGGVGTMAVQWAKAHGATVTGVCSHRNITLVESLGADAVIDYTQEDFARHTGAYDVIFDAFGNRSLSDVEPALRLGGRFVTTDITPPSLGRMVGSWIMPGPSARVVVVQPSGADLRHVMQLVRTGALRPVVDRTFPLCNAAAAHRYSETYRAQGKIVLVTDAHGTS